MTMVSAILSASLMVSASGSPPELQKLDAQRNPPAATDAFQAVSADITRSSTALGGSAFAVPTGTSRATGTQPLRTIDESWTRSIVVMGSDAKARRDELLRRFGPVVGQLRGLDRFVTAVEDGSVEILIDPQTNVIREWNLVKKGELEARGSSAYELAAGDTLLRRNARVERLLPNGTGSRMTTEVDLANVRFESR